MTLRTQFPDAYRELLRHKLILEQYFKGPVDFEFTIESGRVFVLNARRARLSALAVVRTAIDFFLEGKTTLHEAISSISPESVGALIGTEIRNRDLLQPIGHGLPASRGSATGRVLLKDSVDVVTSGQTQIIYVCEEVSPEDIHILFASEGVLTARGGKSSHAAVVARGIGKPCVSGCKALTIDSTKRTLSLGQTEVSEGDWVTIDGTNGSVFLGQAEIRQRDWQSIPELKLLYFMVRHALLVQAPHFSITAALWAYWDFFIHHQPLAFTATNKKPAPFKISYMSFDQPSHSLLSEWIKKVHPIPDTHVLDFGKILLGFHMALSRAFAARIGIGKHHKYFRPLWDPVPTINNHDAGRRFQFVGFEFFNISKYIEYLPDLDDMRFYLQLELDEGQSGWFLDNTNPNGESLIVTDCKIVGFGLYVNGAIVPISELPCFYNLVRRREYSLQSDSSLQAQTRR